MMSLKSFGEYLKWARKDSQDWGCRDYEGFEEVVGGYLKGFIDEGGLKEDERGELASLLDGLLGRMATEGPFKNKLRFYRERCVE